MYLAKLQDFHQPSDALKFSGSPIYPFRTFYLFWGGPKLVWGRDSIWPDVYGMYHLDPPGPMAIATPIPSEGLA